MFLGTSTLDNNFCLSDWQIWVGLRRTGALLLRGEWRKAARTSFWLARQAHWRESRTLRDLPTLNHDPPL